MQKKDAIFVYSYLAKTLQKNFFVNYKRIQMKAGDRILYLLYKHIGG